MYLCLASALLAQDYRGKVRGTVTDSSQAVIAGATVTLANNNTGVRTVKQTNETGSYLFDYVDPGPYTLSIEFSGFKKFVQEKINLEARSDVTVNGVLNPGSAQEAITVTDTPVAVNFNNPNVQLTIDTKLTNDLPRFDRNPFKLGLLAPYAVNTRTEMNPYNSWAANSIDLGGSTSLKNDLVIDGSPIGIGHKARERHDVEVAGVEAGDELGSGDHEQLVAALEVGPAEVVGGEAGGLDAGAHGAVVDDDPFTGGGEEVAHGWFSWRVEVLDRRDGRSPPQAGAISPFPSGQLGPGHGTRATSRLRRAGAGGAPPRA